LRRVFIAFGPNHHAQHEEQCVSRSSSQGRIRPRFDKAQEEHESNQQARKRKKLPKDKQKPKKTPPQAPDASSDVTSDKDVSLLSLSKADAFISNHDVEEAPVCIRLFLAKRKRKAFGTDMHALCTDSDTTIQLPVSNVESEIEQVIKEINGTLVNTGVLAVC
jgi:hypothetical protein